MTPGMTICEPGTIVFAFRRCAPSCGLHVEIPAFSPVGFVLPKWSRARARAGRIPGSRICAATARAARSDRRARARAAPAGRRRGGRTDPRARCGCARGRSALRRCASRARGAWRTPPPPQFCAPLLRSRAQGCRARSGSDRGQARSSRCAPYPRPFSGRWTCVHSLHSPPACGRWSCPVRRGGEGDGLRGKSGERIFERSGHATSFAYALPIFDAATEIQTRKNNRTCLAATSRIGSMARERLVRRRFSCA